MNDHLSAILGKHTENIKKWEGKEKQGKDTASIYATLRGPNDYKSCDLHRFT